MAHESYWTQAHAYRRRYRQCHWDHRSSNCTELEDLACRENDQCGGLWHDVRGEPHLVTHSDLHRLIFRIGENAPPAIRGFWLCTLDWGLVFGEWIVV
jgi:hypothetical protein